jgi:cell division protein FtsZ
MDIFSMANQVLGAAVRGISDLIVKPGFVKVDFADVRTIMKEGGMALMGTGSASGSGRACDAAHKAVSNPLLEDISIRGARGILINITSSQDFSMDELKEICSIIQEEAHESALTKWGLVFDDSLGEELRVTVIATGIGRRSEMERERHVWTAPAAEPVEVEDVDIPTFLRKGADISRGTEGPGADKRHGSLGAMPGKKYVVHPDLQYEESELDTPPFLRKTD